MPTKRGITIEHDDKRNTSEDVNQIRIPSQSQRQSDSVIFMNSSLFSRKEILRSPVTFSSESVNIAYDREHLSLPPLAIENTENYVIIPEKTKDQQIEISTGRSIFHSQRNYGEVYVRHRVNFLHAEYLITNFFFIMNSRLT